MLTLEEGAFLVKAARNVFFAFLKGNTELQVSEHVPSIVAGKAGAYVRVFGAELELEATVLGFTGYPMPARSLYRTVIDASEAIAARKVKQQIDEAVVSFEVTVLSPPKLLNSGRAAELVSNVKLGRDVLMVASPGFKKAIILPQTAVKTCKDEVDFLSDCCMAAGLMADAWLTTSGVCFYKFKAQIFRETRHQKDVTEISLERSKLSR